MMTICHFKQCTDVLNTIEYKTISSGLKRLRTQNREDKSMLTEQAKSKIRRQIKRVNQNTLTRDFINQKTQNKKATGRRKSLPIASQMVREKL